MSVRYFDIDSTYRNRNEWPLPSEFVIPISTSGTKPVCEALDPVCLSSPIHSWRSYDFNTYKDALTTTYVTTSVVQSFVGINDNYTFVVETYIFLPDIGNLQQEDNYYQGAVIIVKDLSDPSYLGVSRITKYRWLGKNTVGFLTTSDRAEISVDIPVRVYPADISYVGPPPIVVTINDPSNFSNLCFPLVFIPEGRLVTNAYPNYFLYNESTSQYRTITNYSPVTHNSEIDMSKQDPCRNTNKCLNDNGFRQYYSIRKELPQSIEIVKNVYNGTKIVFNSKRCFECAYVRISQQNLPPPLGVSDPLIKNPASNEIRRIVGTYLVTDDSKPPEYSGNAIVICEPFSSDVKEGTKVEILPISYDNAVPFNYNGSWIQEDCCYEIRISSLVLPNAILNVASGGNIAYYPFIYVEFSSCSSSGQSIDNLYSNNPHSTKAMFRIPVQDTTNPLTRPFILLGGDSQIVKFKPNENIKFSVKMDNGELFNTVLEENYSPFEPNPYCQIKALISIRKI